MTDALVLRDVVKKYHNGFRAVHGVSLGVGEGELCVFVGPSGCGKSTLLRMVAGLETVTSGEILLKERRINDVEPSERDIAMVFQNYALYPHMTVYKNLAYGLKNRRTPKAEIERRVREAATMLQIEALLERRPQQLSGGQRQRVAMGRAIVREPKLFLFDEPLSNLDAKLRNQMRLEIRKLQRRLGVASIYVTHDQIEAMTLADKIVVLNLGRIEQIGPPTEVYRRPASTFVASFMGAPPMNLAPARVENGGVRLGETVIGPAPAGRADGPITLGFRPEDARFAEAPGEHAPAFALDLIEELGGSRLAHGRLAGAADVVVSRPSEEGPIDAPSALWLRPEALHFFDPQTGGRIDADAPAAAQAARSAGAAA